MPHPEGAREKPCHLMSCMPWSGPCLWGPSPCCMPCSGETTISLGLCVVRDCLSLPHLALCAPPADPASSRSDQHLGHGVSHALAHCHDRRHEPLHRAAPSRSTCHPLDCDHRRCRLAVMGCGAGAERDAGRYRLCRIRDRVGHHGRMGDQPRAQLGTWPGVRHHDSVSGLCERLHDGLAGRHAAALPGGHSHRDCGHHPAEHRPDARPAAGADRIDPAHLGRARAERPQ